MSIPMSIPMPIYMHVCNDSCCQANIFMYTPAWEALTEEQRENYLQTDTCFICEEQLWLQNEEDDEEDQEESQEEDDQEEEQEESQEYGVYSSSLCSSCAENHIDGTGSVIFCGCCGGRGEDCDCYNTDYDELYCCLCGGPLEQETVEALSAAQSRVEQYCLRWSRSWS